MEVEVNIKLSGDSHVRRLGFLIDRWGSGLVVFRCVSYSSIISIPE